MPFADVSFGDLLLLVFEIFLFVAWIWILFTIIGDLFRDHEMSGFVEGGLDHLPRLHPVLSVLVYLIVRGYGDARTGRSRRRPTPNSTSTPTCREQAESASPGRRARRTSTT